MEGGFRAGGGNGGGLSDSSRPPIPAIRSYYHRQCFATGDRRPTLVRRASLKWPGLPRGVKFDPSDEELLWHLLAEIGEGETEPHPFIGEFITSLDDHGVGYSFPLKLPGVKQDGSLSYFFHRPFKTDESKSRKRRKIPSDELGTVRWHKIGKTEPVYVDGICRGSKKVMVLYMSMVDGEEPEKTNWMMHQYHVGVGDDVQGGLVISKIFYKLKLGQGEKSVHNYCIDTVETIGMEAETEVSPKVIGPEPHANSNSFSMEVSNQDIVIDNYDPKAEPFGEIYCNTAIEGEASQPMLNPFHSTQDAQAHIGRHAISVKVEPSDCMEENACNEVVEKISSTAMNKPKLLCASEHEEIDHVTLQERYKLMLCSMNQALGCSYNVELGQDIAQCATGFDLISSIHGKDSEVIPRKEKYEGPMDRLETGHENISAPEDPLFTPNIHIREECSSRRVKDEIQPADAQFLHEEKRHYTRQRDDASHLVANDSVPSLACVDNSVSEVNCSDENHESRDIFTSEASTLEVSLPVVSQESGQLDDTVTATCSSMATPCVPEATRTVEFISGIYKSKQYQEGRDSSQACVSGVRLLDSVQGLLYDNDDNHSSDTVPSVCNLKVKAERLEEGNSHCIPQKDPEDISSPAEMDLNSNRKLHNLVLSRCSIRPKLDFMDSGPGSIIKRERVNELTTDFIDHIPLRERMWMLPSASVTNFTCGKTGNTARQTLPPQECGSSNIVDDKEKRFSLRRKRKKTATDSVETALEEDAPGLLQVLLDKGVIVEEIKLYGDLEDDADLPICSSEDSFDELENVITKLFCEGPSIFKFPSLQKIKGSKAVYCLACLISLIEQARYLHFRQSPVEWGWCRDLQSFIFVFERHNRIVLERPEYGYATYFFELVESLPIDWQIKRLVTAMKLPCCSRTILLENRPILVGQDLTEGEACVMEEYGWIRNSGLGTMLKYCDRVVHDKKNERYSLEWRAKIGKLLMKGHDSGRTVLSNFPKKAVHYIEHENPGVKLEI